MLDAVITWHTTKQYKRNSLKYALRGLYYNLPWLNNIYLVTNDQWPIWLNEESCKNINPKIIRIDHRQIHPESRPMFGAHAIEICLNRIPNLSEYFIFANDDTFVTNYMPISDWINKDGKGIYRSAIIPESFEEYKSKKYSIDFYKWAQIRQYELCCSVYKNVEFMVHFHQVSIMCKAAFRIAKEKFPDIYEQTLKIDKNITHDIIARNLLEYIAIKEGLCEEIRGCNFSMRESLFVDATNTDISQIKLPKDLKLLCINNIYNWDNFDLLESLLPTKIPSEI